MADLQIETKRLASLFPSFESATAKGEPAWLTGLREAAIRRFIETGLPTTREEDWRLTNLSPMADENFQPLPVDVPPAQYRAHVEDYALFRLGGPRLVFVNGRFSPEFSSLPKAAEGLVVTDLRLGLARSASLVEKELLRFPVMDTGSLRSLNTAFFGSGALIEVPAGITVSEPIHFIFVSKSNGTKPLVAPRNIVILRDGASASLVESHVGFGSDAYLTAPVTDIAVGANAKLRHYRVTWEGDKAYHLGTTQVTVGRDATYNSEHFTVGGRMVRSDIVATLTAPGSEVVMNGLYLTHGNQHVDTHTWVDHAAPNGRSNEFFKGILADHSRGIFDGKVIVRPNASKTDARQLNKNLLLSEDAMADTNPRLEIYNDDVKCSHGATIGSLDEDAIFYLRSRGLSLPDARNLLTYAFANEMVEKIEIPELRTMMSCLLTSRLLTAVAPGGKAP